MSLDGFIDQLKSMDVDVERVLDTLKATYVCYPSLPYMKGTPFYENGRKIRGGESIYPVDELVIKVLQRYNLVDSHNYGSKENRIYSYVTTEKGGTIASEAIGLSIEENVGEIRQIINRFSKKIVYITVLGTLTHSGHMHYIDQETRPLVHFPPEIDAMASNLDSYEFMTTMNEMGDILNELTSTYGHIGSIEKIKEHIPALYSRYEPISHVLWFTTQRRLMIPLFNSLMRSTRLD